MNMFEGRKSFVVDELTEEEREYLIAAADRDFEIRDWSTGFIYNRKTGKIVGRVSKGKYKHTCICGMVVKQHIIAWLIYHGEFPEINYTVDHRNLDTKDNSISNLRLLNKQDQTINSRHEGGASGIKGVQKLKNGRYLAKMHEKAKKGWAGKIKHIFFSYDKTECVKARLYFERAEGWHNVVVLTSAQQWLIEHGEYQNALREEASFWKNYNYTPSRRKDGGNKKSPLCNKCFVNGVEYSSVREAARSIEKHHSVIHKWLRSGKKPDCYYINNNNNNAGAPPL